MSQVVTTGAVTPEPSDDEAAAIAAALAVVLSAPIASGWPPISAAPRWRFSGRWWSKPVPVRRDRPF